MSVRIQLDNARQPFTNLDQISGIVILSLLGPETISEINVKLEGESKSRLAGPTHPQGYHHDPYDARTARLEVHKLPFNNDCLRNNTLLMNLSALRMDMARDTDRHVKKTLPPSLNGLPGEATVHYYVKVTVTRPAFYKENFRSIQPFTFLPIEPPRPPPNKRESFARRTHHFSPAIDIPEKPGLFRKPSQLTDANIPPPNITVDGRLPDPAVVTCCEPLPLRVLVTKKNETPATIMLQLININLIGYTNVRAHELQRQEANVWTILSKSNLKIPLSGSINNDGTETMELDKGLWKDLPLPNTICPSFETCNISRNYEVEIKVGLQWGSSRSKVNPELQVLPLRMPVQVYSGIAPSQALLDQMAARPLPNQQPAPYAASNLRPPGPSTSASPNVPSRPSSQQQQPQQQSDHIEPSPGDIPDEAPPSYEDAMADELAPIDGPRRNYAQDGGEVGDGKGDRLFPDSGR
ncbi:hypothetical protein MMC21_000596 [Puttea exsequens]|nr:hypothetical protein [Puttea exsequens]